KVVHRIDNNAKKFKRATFYKIYLTNTSLRSALFSPINPNDENLGNLVETAVFSQWMHGDWFKPYYARWSNGRQQGEVDMVGLDTLKIKPEWALEIKWSNRYFNKPEELKSLADFCKNNNIPSALVTSINKEGVVNHYGLELIFISSAMYAYTVGANTIEKKKLEL
ncbi:MAG: DUF4143 domain-containing protein, partial [Bacteroidales bacterium]|nr:DUF4143 domain-containing protein [Bacteroidales bacterium]